jgi:hypothetical protein
MGIFIIYISIIRLMFRFDYTNFKALIFNKIINFNGIKNMAYLAMLVIFHVNLIISKNFNLSCIYCIFAKKITFGYDFF